ncbi:DeoR/GlpR transcriptional regulator [Paenalkalicoccus suaedae]|uniref:DeoR/GlpR transcriptional regulator n=1 Tax=Paenalkalicoccus suaedae TaxID=2592382 RepID=A0A859FAF1_9BACI|nr:DeoR/GlpR family DNA-binding transcription regulator [Paenalkalicoccus suaedae]QKS69742.1 DeoR/GlpR transcriptional regulator [Paenalkalicoccus suaedae]
MLSIERYEKIMNELDKNGTVRVSFLSKALHVTNKTIRIDLEHLEEKGLLQRIHGGAILPKSENQLLPIKDRQEDLTDVKHAIALEAIKEIQDGDTILIDGGSTTYAFAKALPDIPITVITNDIHIASAILRKSQIQLMVTGGTRIGESAALFGSEAERMLQHIRVNKIFFGTTGLSLEGGLTVFNAIHADWKRKALNCSKKYILLADASKFDKDALIQFSSIEQVGTIITDDQLSEEIATRYKSKGIHLIIASGGKE